MPKTLIEDTSPPLIVLSSKEDSSVNFVSQRGEREFLEARFVRRSPDYVVVYVSTQTGCRQACRMCHLTAMKQTRATDATAEEIIGQANEVLDWYSTQSPAQLVHFNFMARGEPLASQAILTESEHIFERLVCAAREYGLRSRILVSTIMPNSLRGLDLGDIFPRHFPEIYYSLYSLDPAFRKKWLPNALPAEEALDMLADYQRLSRKVLKLHWAFISGENDDEGTVRSICDAILRRNLHIDVNVVRYNSFSPQLGAEPCEETIARNASLLRKLLPTSRVDVIPRVGFDVKASCGMFVAKSLMR